MSQDPSNSPVDPALPNELNQQQQPPPPPAPRKRRRRWPWVIVSIVLVLILLVVLGPTIASTGPVRSFVAPGGQRLAIYELTRPGVVDGFAGRRDF